MRAGSLDGESGSREHHVVANGVDTVYFRPPDVEVEPAPLVFAGRLRYHANVRALRLLLDAIMPRVWAARPDARLRVVGEDPPRAVRALAARHPERVEVTGWVPDVRPHLATATVSVAPLVYAVGVQNKVLGRGDMALPVIATAPAAAAIGPAGDCMLVVRDEVEFASAVVRLLGDAPLRRRLGTAARRYVESHHRWESAAARLAELYEEEIARFAGAAGSGRCATGENPNEPSRPHSCRAVFTALPLEGRVVRSVGARSPRVLAPLLVASRCSCA